MPAQQVHDYQQVIELYATHTVDQITEKLGYASRNVVAGIIHRARNKGLIVPQKSRFTLTFQRLSPEQREARRVAVIEYHRKRRAEHPELFRQQRQTRRRKLTALEREVVTATARGQRPSCKMDRDVFQTFAFSKVTRDQYAKAKARKEAAPPEPAPLLLSLFDMSDSKCHWIHGDLGQPGYGYCGHPTDGEGAYCAHHHALMHPCAKTSPAGAFIIRQTRSGTYV